MIEVEVRAKIDCFEAVLKRLSGIGAKYIGSKVQEDRIFGRKESLDLKGNVIEGHFVGRIRSENGAARLEFKEIFRSGGGLEFSSPVSNIDCALNFLNKLGFFEAFSIFKKREEFFYKDFIICVDAVEGLGNFIEVELMIEEKKDEVFAREKCVNLLKTISNSFVIENRKYGDLMQEKLNGK